MNETSSLIEQQLAQTAGVMQQERTGVAPTAVTATLRSDILVLTMLGALTPAEQALSRTLEGAARVQEFHRQLFSSSVESMWQEIKKVTGRDVCQAASQIDPGTGAVVQTFSTGAMVQVFLLDPQLATSPKQEPTDRSKHVDTDS